MNQIKKPIRIVMYYLPNGYGYGNKKDGFLSLTVNHSAACLYSYPIKGKDLSVRQLAQYLEKCIEGANNEA